METGDITPTTSEASAEGIDAAPDTEAAMETETAPADAVEPHETENSEGKGKAAREAARYRTRLRETEAKLEAVTARLEAMQLEVARKVAVSAGLVAGEEFNFPVSDFTDPDTGLVNTDKVHELVRNLIKAKPYLDRYYTRYSNVPVPGNGSDPMFLLEAEEQGWSGFLKQQH